MEFSPVIACDTETFSTTDHPRGALDPYTGKVRLLQVATKQPVDQVFIVDCLNLRNIEDFVNIVLGNRNQVKIFQNGKFDFKMLHSSFGTYVKGTIFDTMVAHKLINFQSKANLEFLAKDWLNIILDKELQKSNFSGELTKSQLLYAANDVKILHSLREAMRKRLLNLKLINTAKAEFDSIRAFAEMEFNGLPINEVKWLEVSMKLEEDIREAKGSNSPDFRKLCNVNNVWGRNFLDNINLVTGCFHTDYKQIATIEGKIGTYGLNLEDMPRPTGTDDFRKCFEPKEEGCVFVIGSWFVVNKKELGEEIGKKSGGYTIEKAMNEFKKRVLAGLYNRIKDDKLDVAMCAVVKDEVILECDNGISGEVKKMFEQVIYDAWGVFRVNNPVIPEVKIFNCWE